MFRIGTQNTIRRITECDHTQRYIQVAMKQKIKAFFNKKHISKIKNKMLVLLLHFLFLYLLNI
jgi:hypothetical protein